MRLPVYMPCVGGNTRKTIAFTQGDSNIFLTEVGYDYFSPDSYYIMVNMHSSELGTEYMFGLTTSNRFQGFASNTFDSTIANSIVPKRYRAGVTKVLLDQTESLVRLSNKDRFFMVTYLPNLPPKALVKYDLLAHVFKSIGYDVVQTEPEVGKHMWQMNRKVAAPFDVSGGMSI